MADPKVYEVLASTFIQEDVSTCFALLGDANMNWAAAMSTAGCKFVYVRHEHCAVAAAMAYSRSTGEIGVATVTCGPGLTQVMTALPAAVRANIPIVIFAGEGPVKKSWYNQGIEQKPFVEACGAEYMSLQHQPTMRAGIRDAFLKARVQQRPVVIGVPFDLQHEDWQHALNDLPPSRALMPKVSPVLPSAESVKHAASFIDNSKKVIVMAGLGAVRANAGPVCEELARRLGALLATSLPARGLFYKDDFYLGVAGGFSSEVARRLIIEADLIIAVGCSLSNHNSDAGKLFGASKVLQVDINPVGFNQGRRVSEQHLQGDARESIESLLQHVKVRDEGSEGYWRTPSIAAEIKNTPADSAEFEIEPGLLDPRDVVSELDALIPTDWFTVNSSGHCSCFFAQMKNRPADKFLTIREFGAIGNGISFSMGVAVANPSDPVVLFDGDGSLMMHIQEFETIIRHNLNILIVVINDGAYGSEIHKMRAEGISEEGAVFGRPSFASIAKGFGAQGETITDIKDLAPAVHKFSQAVSDTPGEKKVCRLTVLDVHVSDKVVSSVIRRSHAH